MSTTAVARKPRLKIRWKALGALALVIPGGAMMAAGAATPAIYNSLDMYGPLVTGAGIVGFIFLRGERRR